MCNYFRTLRADEIEVRVQRTEKSASGVVWSQLLLYKDARVDMTLLDEHFGVFGWQREHSVKAINYNKRREIIGIDIVDNSGKTRFKFGITHDNLFTAKQEMNDAESYYEATTIWRKYPDYHDDAGFIAAKAEKEKQFNA